MAIDFRLTDEQEELRDGARSFAQEVLAPLVLHFRLQRISEQLLHKLLLLTKKNYFGIVLKKDSILENLKVLAV